MTGFFVTQATPAMVYEVSKNMRERDFQELRAVSWEDDREKMAQGLAVRYGDFPMAFCLGWNNKPICILTAVNAYPGVWSMGMWATRDLPKIGKELNIFSMRDLFLALRLCGMHRVECKSIVGYTQVHKWLRHIGFVQGETEVMYGKNKEDFVTFFWNESLPWPRGYDPTAESPGSRPENQNAVENQGEQLCANQKAGEMVEQPIERQRVKQTLKPDTIRSKQSSEASTMISTISAAPHTKNLHSLN